MSSHQWGQSVAGSQWGYSYYPASRIGIGAKAPRQPKSYKCTRKDCDVVEKSLQRLVQHRWAEGHFNCDICGEEFHNNDDTLELHKFKYHPDSQNLECPGCGERFSKAGSHMQHVESRGCPVITPEWMQSNERKTKVEEFKAGLRGLNPANPVMDGVSSLTLDASKESGMARPVTKPDVSHQVYVHRNVSINEEEFPKPEYNLARFRSGGVKGPDLLTGDEPGPPAAPFWEQQDNPSGQEKNLFTEAPPAAVFTAQQLEAVSAPAPKPETDDEGRIIDPDVLGFDTALFYEPLLGKFKCPHRGCSDKCKTSGTIEAHLRSPKHKKPYDISCPCCLGHFYTLSAGMQHAETANINCNIRKSENFRVFVAQLTGGMLDAFNNKTKDGKKTYVNMKFFVPNDFIASLPVRNATGVRQNLEPITARRSKNFW